MSSIIERKTSTQFWKVKHFLTVTNEKVSYVGEGKQNNNKHIVFVAFGVNYACECEDLIYF